MRITTALLLGLLACGDKDGGDDTSTGGDADTDADTDTDGGEDLDPDTVPLAGTCAQESRYGRFTVDSNEDYASVAGAVADGVVPTDVLTELLTEGDCTIWRRENPFCDPGCDPGYTCDLSGECVPYPTNQAVGTVTISGLLGDVAMEPVEPGATYFDTSLPNPPWDPGVVATLRSGGGAHDAFTLHGVTPETMAIEDADWLLVPGEDLTVTWAPAAEGARTSVELGLRIDQHGLTPSTLRCIFPDTGTGTVPASVLDALIDVGLTGFPNGILTRQSIDSTDLSGGGCAELRLQSSQLAEVEIEGYTPCRRDEDCPDGQECNEALERCE
jgi:hypothetical protein